MSSFLRENEELPEGARRSAACGLKIPLAHVNISNFNLAQKWPFSCEFRFRQTAKTLLLTRCSKCVLRVIDDPGKISSFTDIWLIDDCNALERKRLKKHVSCLPDRGDISTEQRRFVKVVAGWRTNLYITSLLEFSSVEFWLYTHVMVMDTLQLIHARTKHK